MRDMSAEGRREALDGALLLCYTGRADFPDVSQA